MADSSRHHRAPLRQFRARAARGVAWSHPPLAWPRHYRRPRLRPPFFGRGTFPPARRASERPMAIACFRLVTFLPERPERSLPRFFSCMLRATFERALPPYFREDFVLRPLLLFVDRDDLLVAMRRCRGNLRASLPRLARIPSAKCGLGGQDDTPRQSSPTCAA
jgi:hypothetical protein